MRAVLLLFFSGATALSYQTIWVKQLGLLLGVDVHAVTTAVAAFSVWLAAVVVLVVVVSLRRETQRL